MKDEQFKEYLLQQLPENVRDATIKLCDRFLEKHFQHALSYEQYLWAFFTFKQFLDKHQISYTIPTSLQNPTNFPNQIVQGIAEFFKQTKRKMQSFQSIKQFSNKKLNPSWLEKDEDQSENVSKPEPQNGSTKATMSSQNQFDVFLCHNSKDKPEVKQIGEKLKQQGLKPWLDEWELRPGLSLMEQLEETIRKIKSKNLKSAAVFIGNNGLGPWQKKEIEVFLNLSTSNKYPLIPVLLSTAPQGAESQFSFFLATNFWVDFRYQQPEPMGQLIWGITRRRP